MPIDLPAPRVSVVIPTFNRPVLIKRALWSVFEQTFDDFEVLLVDDGSTDETPEVLAAFRDVRLRTVGLEQNQGGARARNVGIERARGEWVAFLDSDDTWLPEKLERQLALADSDRTASVFYCSCYRDDPKRGRYIQTDQDIPNGDPLEGLLRDRRPKTTSVFLVKRDVLRQLGGFDEAFPSSQDIDLWLRLARAGNRFRGLNDPLAVKYNHQGDQISSDPIALVRGFHMMDKRGGGGGMRERAGRRTYYRWIRRRMFRIASANVRHLPLLLRRGQLRTSGRYLLTMTRLLPLLGVMAVRLVVLTVTFAAALLWQFVNQLWKAAEVAR